MSTPPRVSERKRTPVPANDDASVSAIGKAPTLAERLPGMTDFQLRAYQSSADRISRDTRHPRHGAAVRAIPKIEAEIRRRADEPDTPK